MPSSVDIGDTGTLFVLTNNVYAKKEDGLFYPGSVESKQDDTYRILFADNTRDTLPEKYVTWVAFCGLPPSSWPKNPIVQPAIPAEKQYFEEACVKFVGDTVSEKPASLKVLKEEDIESCGSESQCDIQSSPHKHLWSRKRASRDEGSKEGEQFSALKLMRSSVLRINTKALSKGKESSDLPNSSISSDNEREPIPQSSFQPTTKCLLKRTNFRSMLAPRTTENMFEMTRCSCGSLGMPKFETKLCRCTNDEEELDRETVEYYARATYPSPFPHRPYPNLDWYDATHFGQSSPTSPIAPPSLPTGMDHERQASMHSFWAAQRHVRESLAPRFDLSLYTHDPYGIRMVREDWKENASGLGPGKKRRKDGLKKCRKVYGVYNRNLWCTQCKWKKACTRFRA